MSPFSLNIWALWEFVLACTDHSARMLNLAVNVPNVCFMEKPYY